MELTPQVVRRIKIIESQQLKNISLFTKVIILNKFEKKISMIISNDI